MWLIEIKGGNGLLNILPQFIPCVGLRKDAFAQTFSNETSIRFLCNFKHEFIHFTYLPISLKA